MRTYLRAALILSLCLAMQQALAAAYQTTTKGSHSSSKSKLDLNLRNRPATIPGERGATGPTGTPFVPVYAAAFQENAQDFGILSAGVTVTVPFTTIDYSNGISLNSASNTFTLPMGTYFVYFQFSYEGDRNGYIFDPLYLNVGGSQINLSTFSGGTNNNDIAVFFGSTIFDVPEDNTQVSLRFKIKTVLSANPLIFTAPSIANNYPTRIVFQKIDELDTSFS
jgi:hypothetical protein